MTFGLAQKTGQICSSVAEALLPQPSPLFFYLRQENLEIDKVCNNGIKHLAECLLVKNPLQ